MSKRPRGLAKTKEKKRASSPPPKKQKLDDEEAPILADDWEDLQELFARAINTFMKGGQYSPQVSRSA